MSALVERTLVELFAFTLFSGGLYLVYHPEILVKWYENRWMSKLYKDPATYRENIEFGLREFRPIAVGLVIVLGVLLLSDLIPLMKIVF